MKKPIYISGVDSEFSSVSGKFFREEDYYILLNKLVELRECYVELCKYSAVVREDLLADFDNAFGFGIEDE